MTRSKASVLSGLVSSCFGCCDGADVTDNGEHELPRQAERELKRSGGRVQTLSTRAPVKTAVLSPRASPAVRSGPARAAAALGASPAACSCLVDEDARTEVFAVRDSPWLVIRSGLPDVRLRWLDKDSGLLSWTQPLPQLVPLSGCDFLAAQAACMSFAAAEMFEGAPQSAVNPAARTGITGGAPDQERLRRTCQLLSPEHVLYPAGLFEAVGVTRIVFCEDLHYNGQRRRDVPDLASGNLYIDVGDRAPRRKRHAFHHELFHLIDYRLRGPVGFTALDVEWEAHNPNGFQYGQGGKFMRHDADSSQLSSAPPGGHFVNRYSTSAITEDKAEVWAALMCYDVVLHSPQLRGKARLLRERVACLCAQMDTHWWERVREAQATKTNLWERHERGQDGGGFLHFLTGEYVKDTPEVFSLDAA